LPAIPLPETVENVPTFSNSHSWKNLRLAWDSARKITSIISEKTAETLA
jgi:hypothetical protein